LNRVLGVGAGLPLDQAVYNNAAERALGNARNLIDGSSPYAPIFTTKPMPARPAWAQAIRDVEGTNQRVAAAVPSCRSESAGRLLVLTDEIWKEQEETHGTRWVHGWDAIERAQKLSRHVDDELAHCMPPAPPPPPVVSTPEKPVSLSADALFDFDSAKLKSDGLADVDTLADSLKKSDAIDVVTVIGYTDRFGSAAHNRDLSRRRAQAVSEELAARGVKAVHFDVRGAGSSAPLATCPGPKSAAVIACLAPNRRVEIRFAASFPPASAKP
jgi:outer membrane protein OmpA-like peptidoglycan-associated protein